MTGYKNSILKRQSLSKVKMHGGSPIREKLSLKILEQFQRNVPQRKIAKILNIPPSTVHHIIERFRESGEISLCTGQGQKSILDAHEIGPSDSTAFAGILLHWNLLQRFRNTSCCTPDASYMNYLLNVFSADSLTY